MQLVYGEGFFSPGGEPEVARIVKGLDLARHPVLDVGCGLGGPAVALARNHAASQVVGIDVEQSVLDIAEARVKALGLQTRVTLQRVEPGPLPFPDQMFGLVYASDVVCHMNEPIPFFEEVKRVLTPDGWFVGSDWFRGEAETASRNFDEWAAELRARGLDFYFLARGDFTDALCVMKLEVSLEDTSAAVRTEAEATMARIRGPLRSPLTDILGETGYRDLVKGGKARTRALEDGTLLHCRFRVNAANATGTV